MIQTDDPVFPCTLHVIRLNLHLIFTLNHRFQRENFLPIRLMNIRRSPLIASAKDMSSLYVTRESCIYIHFVEMHGLWNSIIVSLVIIVE
jgi:hypothetical protein